MPNLSELYALYEMLQTDRVETEQRWQDIIDYILPDRPTINTAKSKNDQEMRRSDYLLDGTGILANARLSSNMSAFLNGPSIPWFMLGVEDQKKRKKESKQWLGECKRLMQDSMARTNFYREANVAWNDFPGFCSVGFYMEDTNGDGKKLRYESTAITDLYVKENVWRQPEVCIHPTCMSIYNIEKRWPQAANLDTIKKRKRDTHGIWEELEVVHFCVPSDMWDGKISGNGTMAIASIYAIKDEEIPLNEENGVVPGYRRMPYSLARWERASRMVYGIGPGTRSVYDIKSLNLLVQRIQEALPMAINPPIKVEDGAVMSWGDNGQLSPGCQIITEKGKFDRLAPMYESGRGIQIGEIERKQMQDLVREHFYYNDLLLYPERPEMTAYEIQRRFEMLQRNFSSPVGFIQSDWHDPVVEWTFETMERHGLFPDRPEILKDVPIKVEYIGPLARAQNLPETLATQEWVQRVVAAAMSADKKELLDIVKWYDLFATDAEKSGVPLELLEDPEVYRKKIEAQENAIRQQQEMEQLKTGAQALQAGGRGLSQLRSA